MLHLVAIVMNKSIESKALVSGCLFWIIISCNVAKNYQPPTVTNAQLYRGTAQVDTVNFATLNYKEVFYDTTLQGLIQTGLNNNLDLQVAYTRIQQSQAFYLQSISALIPTLNSNAGITASKLSLAQGFGIRNTATLYVVGLSSTWEADVWGRLNSNKRASLADLLQTEAAARAVKTGLVAQVANLYFSLLALDQQLAITRQTVLNWDTTVLTIKELKKAALVTEAAVVQSQAQMYAVEVTIPDLKRSIRETENALSILLGDDPHIINRNDLDNEQVTKAMQTGIPAQLLANRPDVQQAELNYRANYELTNVARAFFYPSLTITGSAGLNALRASDFFDVTSLAASIGAGLVQPIFNQRQNRTRLLAAEAAQKGALLSFQNILLVAGQEVSDALYSYSMASEKMSTRVNQLNALQKSVDYSQELLKYGFANYTEVIQARQLLLAAELGKVNDRLQQLQATVSLYRALGGGWRE